MTPETKQMTDPPPAEAEKVAEAEGQLVPAGNTDSYVTTLSKEDEERLLKVGPESPHYRGSSRHSNLSSINCNVL